MQINIDGLPLSRSSNNSFWPILGKCVSPVASKVFIIGLYHGDKKPSSVHEYLSLFIRDCLQASTEGLQVGEVKYDFEIHSIVCDAPARQFVKCIKPHTGYYACERCTVKGKHNEKKGVRFHEVNCPVRTNQSFREKLHDVHHIGVEVSPFCDLDVDMIASFPLDYMHLVLLGVVRRFLKCWLGLSLEKKKTFARLHRSSVSIMNCRQKKFSISVPFEFQRRPRSFSFAGVFKATELRMFLCYLSPAVMLRIFKTAKIYQHFMLLVTAMRILLSPGQSNESVMFARNCLVSFVKFAPSLYGNACHVYNVHNLVHLADDYDRYGNLDRVSSFPFESFLFNLKSYIKRPGKELEQVVKRLHEEHNILTASTDEQKLQLKGQHSNGPLGQYLGKDVIQYSELVYGGRVFRLKQLK